MAESPPEQVDAAPAEAGTVLWFDAKKKMGVITRADGSTIFVPPYGLAEGQGPLIAGQAASFVPRENAKGAYAAEVQAAGVAPAHGGDAVLHIAEALGETAPQPLAQIRRILRHLGAKVAWGHVAEAQRVEAAGGMMLPDGSRRRTLGGVFFFLVREALTEEKRDVVFPPAFLQKKKAKPKSEAPPPPPPPPPLTWEDRIALVEALRPHSGKAITVKVTVIGRPGQIEERPQVTLLTLTHVGPMPMLPKGMPIPDPLPATTYSIYIGKKQWKLVAEALQNPEDVLIVEGTQIFDGATGTIAVYATKTTTKLLQQASRQPRPPAQES